MVPDGWVRAKINDFGEVTAGRQRSPSYVAGTARPYLRVANVFDGYIDATDVLEMPFTNDEFEKYRLEIGDILLNEGQSLELVGRPAMYVGKPMNCCFQNTLVRFRARNKINRDFALQRFRLCLYDGTFRSIASKTTSIAHLGVSRFANLKLSWPPLLEQKKIAKILAIWDRAIEATEKLIENSAAQKNALMQQLLTGRKRLPGLSSEWQWLKASEVFRPVSKRANFDEELLSVTQEQGVVPRSILERKVVMPRGATSNYKLVVPGNFVISLRSFQGGLEYSTHRGLVSPAYTVLEPTQPINDSYYRNYFKSSEFIGRLAVAVIGIRDGKQINYGDFSFLRLPYPPFDEQGAIAKALDAADAEHTNHLDQLTNLKEQKKALMQQLLTGKRRVKVTA